LKSIILFLLLLGVLGTTGGCAETKPDSPSFELTFNRGAQLLAAGDPKSAIPFLTQTIASAPDGPEPVALLSLAFALDLQPEQALVQAQKVHRPENSPPGWEAVAVGIAELSRHRPLVAIASFQHVLATVPADSPLVPATRQWLALSQIIKGDPDASLVVLEQLAKNPSMKTTALLWTLLIRARDGQTQQAAGTVLYANPTLVVRARGTTTQQAGDALAQCAREVAANFGRPNFEGTLDDQTFYDSAIAALAQGKLQDARQIFLQLQKRNTDGGDAALWLALISAAEGQWQAARAGLTEACETGPIPTRGLANQLCMVVAAMEDRPDAMIQHMLAGQRMMGRDAGPSHVAEYPKRESVWFSDSLK